VERVERVAGRTVVAAAGAATEVVVTALAEEAEMVVRVRTTGASEALDAAKLLPAALDCSRQFLLDEATAVADDDALDGPFSFS